MKKHNTRHIFEAKDASQDSINGEHLGITKTVVGYSYPAYKYLPHLEQIPV